jgi:mono/diheme cytochrome c family protein
MKLAVSLFLVALAAGCAAPAERGSTLTISAERGGDLYHDYCNACHTAQVHWREKHLVKTWDDLRYQVTRWQQISGQNWSREEIDDVAAYLNRDFYGLPR